jgi:hypothetical protein
VKLVAQDREKPSLNVGVGLKLIDVSQAAHHRFLHQVIGLVPLHGDYDSLVRGSFGTVLG